jgi:hypothetical protein
MDWPRKESGPVCDRSSSISVSIGMDLSALNAQKLFNFDHILNLFVSLILPIDNYYFPKQSDPTVFVA